MAKCPQEPQPQFQSTRPVKGATSRRIMKRHNRAVSIHAPREGRDGRPRNRRITSLTFQSTRPVKGATVFACLSGEQAGVSIHAPREGRDVQRPIHLSRFAGFNPRAP